MRTSILLVLSLAACGGGGSSAPSTSTSSSNNSPPASSATNNATGAVGSGGAPVPAAPHSAHKRCGWIGGDAPTDGLATFQANPDYFDAIHPVWFDLQPDGSIVPNRYADDPNVIATARAHGVLLIPLINGADNVAYVRAAMASPGTNVGALAQLADKYDGLDLDYEHLWDVNDRPGYIALLQAAASMMHGRGKLLTVAAPAQDRLSGAYDYVAMIGAGVDEIHLMGYDYHFLGGDHLGPLAPLGWIDSVGAYIAGLGVQSKTILAVANYGLGSGWYTPTAAEALTRCTGPVSDETDHMLSCPYGHPNAGTAPHCDTSQGPIWFENTQSVTEKVDSAASHGLHGIGYWVVGKEPAGFFDAVRSKY
jgi:spore germination protein YaaH